jgi:hypothetical protein
MMRKQGKTSYPILSRIGVGLPILLILMISGIILFLTFSLLVSCTAKLQQEGEISTTTPSGFMFITGEDANDAINNMKSNALILPKGTFGYRLQSVQIPTSQEGLPFLFTYTNGKSTVTLTQFYDGSLYVQPAATQESTKSGQAEIREGKDASFLEMTLTEGKLTELKWNEDKLSVTLRSEQVGLETLIEIADSLIFSK